MCRGGEGRLVCGVNSYVPEWDPPTLACLFEASTRYFLFAQTRTPRKERRMPCRRTQVCDSHARARHEWGIDCLAMIIVTGDQARRKVNKDGYQRRGLRPETRRELGFVVLMCAFLPFPLSSLKFILPRPCPVRAAWRGSLRAARRSLLSPQGQDHVWPGWQGGLCLYRLRLWPSGSWRREGILQRLFQQGSVDELGMGPKA